MGARAKVGSVVVVLMVTMRKKLSYKWVRQSRSISFISLRCSKDNEKKGFSMKLSRPHDYGRFNAIVPFYFIIRVVLFTDLLNLIV